MSLRLDRVPFALDPAGPDGRWTHTDGVLTGRAGPGQDLFVPSPTGQGCGAVFDRIAFLPGGVANLRDGR